MKEEFIRLLPTVPNPFLQDRVDSAWDRGQADVPEINRRAFEECKQALAAVHRNETSRGVMLHGEPGAGKTHLMQRFRWHLQSDPCSWFIYIPPVTTPDRFNRHVLRYLFEDISRRPETGERMTPLETVVGRLLLEDPEAAPATIASHWGDMRSRFPTGQSLFDKLEGPFGALYERLRLDHDTLRVLRLYVAGLQRVEAHAWLLGRNLPERTLECLGVTETLDDEDRAAEAIATFSRLAGHPFAIVLAFDQLEALQVDLQDVFPLRAFARGIVQLFMACRNLLVISCVQISFLHTFKAAVDAADYDRLAQHEAGLTVLDGDQALRLVTKRLQTSVDLQQLVVAMGENNPLFPFTQEEIRGLIPLGGLAARRVIHACRDLFEKAQARIEPPLQPRPPTPPIGDQLENAWERVRAEVAAEPPKKVEEGVYLDGLEKLLEVGPRSQLRRRPAGLKDIDIELKGPQGTTWVAACHAENMTSLARRLGRLREAVQKHPGKRLVIIRDQRLPISAGAKVTRKRLEKLESEGHRVLRPSAEAYVALETLRRLLAAAAAGDLTTADDRTIEPQELRTWLAGNQSPTLRDFREQVLGQQRAQVSAVLEPIQEYLLRQWIAPVDKVVGSLGIAADVIVRAASERPGVIGFLNGPPPSFSYTRTPRPCEGGSMPRVVTVSEIRREIYWANGGPQGAGGGEPVNALVGQLFHETFSALGGPRSEVNLVGGLDQAGPDLPIWKTCLRDHAYLRVVGPQLVRYQGQLQASTITVDTYWKAVQALCGWLCDVMWAQRSMRTDLEKIRQAVFMAFEQEIKVELADPKWSDTVVVQGRLDALVRQPSTGSLCAVELKLGRTAPEADLCQGCLYHILLSKAGFLTRDSPLALLSFQPDPHERIFSAGVIQEAEDHVIALVGKLAGVVGKKPRPPQGGRPSRYADLAKRIVGWKHQSQSGRFPPDHRYPWPVICLPLVPVRRSP